MPRIRAGGTLVRRRHEQAEGAARPVAQPCRDEAQPWSESCGVGTVKGSQKPKKLAKKVAAKTLKERRADKRAAAKNAPGLGA
jgi:hypothetical protein